MVFPLFFMKICFISLGCDKNRVDLEKMIVSNHQLREPSAIPTQRNYFFSLIRAGKSADKAVAKCYPKTCMRQNIKKILFMVHLMR